MLLQLWKRALVSYSRLQWASKRLKPKFTNVELYISSIKLIVNVIFIRHLSLTADNFKYWCPIKWFYLPLYSRRTVMENWSIRWLKFTLFITHSIICFTNLELCQIFRSRFIFSSLITVLIWFKEMCIMKWLSIDGLEIWFNNSITAFATIALSLICSTTNIQRNIPFLSPNRQVNQLCVLMSINSDGKIYQISVYNEHNSRRYCLI